MIIHFHNPTALRPFLKRFCYMAFSRRNVQATELVVVVVVVVVEVVVVVVVFNTQALGGIPFDF